MILVMKVIVNEQTLAKVKSIVFLADLNRALWLEDGGRLFITAPPHVWQAADNWLLFSFDQVPLNHLLSFGLHDVLQFALYAIKGTHSLLQTLKNCRELFLIKLLLLIWVLLVRVDLTVVTAWETFPFLAVLQTIYVFLFL